MEKMLSLKHFYYKKKKSMNVKEILFPLSIELDLNFQQLIHISNQTRYLKIFKFKIRIGRIKSTV